MLSFVLCLILATPGAEHAAALSEVSTITLRDQYGHEDTLEAHRGNVTVVMVVAARRLRNIKPWERELRERFDRLHYVRIADVPEDSPATEDEVAAKLRERVPDGVPVLIDLERRWAKALDLDTSRPNILVVDASGRAVALVRGRHDPELMAGISQTLSSLLDRQ